MRTLASKPVAHCEIFLEEVELAPSWAGFPQATVQSRYFVYQADARAKKGREARWFQFNELAAGRFSIWALNRPSHDAVSVALSAVFAVTGRSCGCRPAAAAC
ncbi:hypothetical protein QAD02_008793 [Eretmocerus hayati]|uniref:Uncharacterized protein n=1 Tax=Eretmocerus hayati TaxID=131215 RepID=A0ACC2N7S8_9HYME|nr:hypothetical protein QAD02_008793 [Eretmocerus hayati]